MILFIETGQFQQHVTETGIQLRRIAEVFGRFAQTVLPRLGPSQPELRRRRFAVDLDSRLIVRLGLGGLVRRQQGFGQIPLRAEFFRFRLRRRVEVRDGFFSPLLAQQHNAQIQLRLIQTGFYLQCLLKFGNCLSILAQHAK